MSPHTNVSQQQPNLNPFDFNQSVVELFQCQTELNTVPNIFTNK